ncbi:MAG: PAS domain-containing protein [Kofleriaceae bacterium]|nr:PAS domain-containing protein [Kofleriaceae bacterium]
MLSGQVARDPRAEPVFEQAEPGPAIDARSILAELPVPVIAVDRERKILVANEQFFALADRCSSVSADEVLALPILAAIDRVLATGAPQRVDGAAIEGSERVFRASLRAMSDRRNVVSGVVVALADVADLGTAETEETARADMYRARDISSTAHELRAQLMTLLLWENLLRSGVLNPDDQQRALQAIRDSASSLSALVGRLLTVATSA